MADKQRNAPAATVSAPDEARGLLEAALRTLKSTALTAEGDPVRGFFPHGVELLYVWVKVGGVEVELKVAGEKGLREGGAPDAEATTRSTADDA